MAKFLEPPVFWSKNSCCLNIIEDKRQWVTEFSKSKQKIRFEKCLKY